MPEFATIFSGFSVKRIRERRNMHPTLHCRLFPLIEWRYHPKIAVQ